MSTLTHRMLPSRISRQHVLEPLQVHRLGERILHHLAHQGMVRDLHLAFEILRARRRVGKDRRQQVIGAHALNLRRNFPPALKAGQQPARARRPIASAR